MNRRRIAVIGSGPAGMYAVERLLQRPGPELEIDIYEKLPVPWGLLRHGVAPDKAERKRIADRLFAPLMRHPRVHWFGNIAFGRHLQPEDLAAWYDAVVYATGAEVPVGLPIPGATLPGSTTALQLVAWYNGHPDAEDVGLDPQSECAVIVGQGNVALDVARLLLMPHEMLAQTDVARRALRWRQRSRLREVVVVGRRSLADAAFQAAAIDSLQTLPELQLVLSGDQPPCESDPARQRFDALTCRKLALLRGLAARPHPPGARRLVLECRAIPQEVFGADRVQGLRGLRAGVSVAWESGIVISAIGQRSLPLPGLPFDEQRGIVPNERGRVHTGEGAAAPAYVVGWLKRGCQGNLGLNRLCAAETVQALLDDLADMPEAERPERVLVAQRLAERQPALLQWADWERIDRAEREAGRRVGAPRVKLTQRPAMLAAARELSIAQ